MTDEEPEVPNEPEDIWTSWNFEEESSIIPLYNSSKIPTINYHGLTIVGAQASNSEDYIDFRGINFSAASTPQERYIKFTAPSDGDILVEFLFQTQDDAPAEHNVYFGINSYNSIGDSMNAIGGCAYTSLDANDTAYIFADAPIYITKVDFVPND